MMLSPRSFCLTLAMVVCTSLSASSQTVNTVQSLATILSDSLKRGLLVSQRFGDTVVVRGLVTENVLTNTGASTRQTTFNILNQQPILLSFLQDESGVGPFRGIPIVQRDPSDTTTLFSTLRRGDLIEARVVVSRIPLSGSTAEAGTILQVLTGSQGRPITIASRGNTIAAAPFAAMDNFNLTQPLTLMAEKVGPYMGSKVELRNLTVIQSSPLVLADSLGRTIQVADYSCNFTMRPHRLSASTWREPSIGRRVLKISGYIVTNVFVIGQGNFNVSAYSICPVLPADLELGPAPPQFEFVARANPNRLFPNPTDNVDIRFSVLEGQLPILWDELALFYRVNDQPAFQRVAAVPSGNEYKATIPAQTAGSIVRFYVAVQDESGATITSPLQATSPVGPLTYYYQVVNGDPTIAMLQQAPPVATIPLLNAARVRLTARVVGTVNDTRQDIQGPRVYMQDADLPWSGIQIASFQPNAPEKQWTRGQLIRFEASPRMSGLMFLNDVQNAEVIGTSDKAPLIIDADSLSTSRGFDVFKWHGMEVELRNVVVKAIQNGQSEAPNGEFTVGPTSSTQASAHATVETDESTIKYTTRDSLVVTENRVKLSVGDPVLRLRGVVVPNNQGVKIIPRDNLDISSPVSATQQPNSSLMIYPQPAGDYVTFGGISGVEGTLQITNALGEDVVVLAMNNTLSADLGSLPSGVLCYSLRLNDGRTFRGTFVKN